VEDLNPLATVVMQEIAMPIAGQRIHHLNDYEDMQFDYVIALCTEAKNSCLAFPRDILTGLAEYLRGDVTYDFIQQLHK
jgi:protein-tyrosine-phosphatase